MVRVGDNTLTSALATINQVDPIYVSFAVPQIFLPDLRAAMAKGPVKVNALVDDQRRQSGEIGFIENTVDSLTGTVTDAHRGPAVTIYEDGSATALTTVSVAADGTWSATVALVGEAVVHSFVATNRG